MKDDALFGVDMGNKSLEIKFSNGVQTRYRVFDLASRDQVDVPGVATRSGSTLTGRFPIPELSAPFDWRAFVFTHGDTYVDSCPETGSEMPERTIRYEP